MRRIALCCALLLSAVGCKCGGPSGALGDVLGSYCKFIDRCPDQLAFPIAYRSQSECVDILNFATTCRLDSVEGPGGENVFTVMKVDPNIDANAASACRTFLESAPCDALLNECDRDTDAGCNPCSRLFDSTGTGGTGGGGGQVKVGLDQPCERAEDCLTGFYCTNPSSTPDGGETCRVCKPLRAAGGDCVNPPYVGCGPGLFCEGMTGVCVGQLPAGTACQGHQQCQSMFCNGTTKVCDNAGNPGQPCMTGADCRRGYCDLQLRCGDRKPNGAACTASSECLNGSCDTATQKCGKPDGATCSSSGECQGYCDSTARQCRSAAANGASCTTGEQCQSRLCHGQLRTCATSCSDGCAATEFCDSYGACRGKLSDGAQCDDDDECSSRFCNDDERCAARPALGGACASSTDCFPKGYCAGGVCTAYVKPGEACTGYESCAAPFFCQNSKCTLMSLSCEPAKAGSQCTWLQVCDSASYCDPFDNFTCKEKKAPGSSCLRSTECPGNQYCNRRARTCTEPAIAGQSCENDEVCAFGLFCDESLSDAKCSPPKAPGESCQEDSNCSTGTCDYTGGSTRTCQAACVPVPPGEQPACKLAKCSDFGFNCGRMDAGCGQSVNCGVCNTTFMTCGGGGQPQVCGCTPTRSCGDRECSGSIDDGCGRQVQCSASCDGGATCNGGGTLGICGCPNDNSAGPSRASMGASVMIPEMGGGFSPWDELDKLSMRDDAGAHVFIDTPANTSKSSLYLVASGFGFNLPPTASVNGVSILVRRRATGQVSDSDVAIFAGGKRVGRSSGGYDWPADWGTASFGSANSLFGAQLTVAQVNAPDFGIGFSARSNGPAHAYVDDVQVTISYAYRCDCTYACKSNSECGNDGCGGTCGSAGGGCGVDGGSCANSYCQPLVFVDPANGLMWSNAAFDVSNCGSLVHGGYDDWRAPTIDELRTRVVGCAATATGGACSATTACTTPGTCLDAGCEGCDYRAGPSPNGCYLDNHTQWNSCTGAGPLFSSTDAGGGPYTLDFGTGRIAVSGGMARYRCVRP